MQFFFFMPTNIKIMFMIYYFTDYFEGNKDSRKEFIICVAKIDVYSQITYKTSNLPGNSIK